MTMASQITTKYVFYDELNCICYLRCLLYYVSYEQLKNIGQCIDSGNVLLVTCNNQTSKQHINKILLSTPLYFLKASIILLNNFFIFLIILLLKVDSLQ